MQAEWEWAFGRLAAMHASMHGDINRRHEVRMAGFLLRPPTPRWGGGGAPGGELLGGFCLKPRLHVEAGLESALGARPLK